MTRQEFTQQLWSQSIEQICWHKDIFLNLDQATYSWWWNPSMRDHWRMTTYGLNQIRQLPKFKANLRSWEVNEPYTSRTSIMLGRLNCPWSMTVADDPRLTTCVCQISLYGEEANMWMGLCAGNLNQFLKTWVDRPV